MALFTGRKTTLTLNTQLADRAKNLRAEQEFEARAAKNYLDAAAEAQEESRVKAAHALAVEQALVILDEAGVVL